MGEGSGEPIEAPDHQIESFSGTESGTELLKSVWRKRG
jgi:hypothetical protein